MKQTTIKKQPAPRIVLRGFEGRFLGMPRRRREQLETTKEQDM